MSHSLWVNSVSFWIIVLVLDRGDISVSSDVFFVQSNLLLNNQIVHVTLGLLTSSDGSSELFLIVLQLTRLNLGRNDGLLGRNIAESLLFEGKEEWLDFADSGGHGLRETSGIRHNHGVDGTLASSVLGHGGHMAAEFDSFLERYGNWVFVTMNGINIVDCSRLFGILYSYDTGDSCQLVGTYCAWGNDFDLAVSLFWRLRSDKQGTLRLWWDLTILERIIVSAVSIMVRFHHVSVSIRILLHLNAIIIGVIIPVLWFRVILGPRFSRSGEIVFAGRELCFLAWRF